MTAPAEKLGVATEVLDPSKKLSTFAALEQDKAAGVKPWDTAAMLCSVTDGLATTYYLQGEWHQAREWAAAMVDSGEYYLFGDWREKAVTDKGEIDPAWWFSSGIGWTIELDYSLCWSAALGAWGRASKLMRFPADEISQDVEGEATREYYAGLAKWWKNHEDLSWIEIIKEMRGAGVKDFQLRCDIVQAISDKSEPVLKKAFEKYLRYWLKQKKTSPQKLAKEATVLWHTAKHEGLDVTIGEDLSAHLICIPEG